MSVVLPSAVSSLLPIALRRLRVPRPSELPAPVARLLPGVLGLLGSVPPLRSLLSQQVINYYGYATAPRPRPLSLGADYTTWRTLTDRRWTGRHLPPATPAVHAAQPAEPDVVALFRREAFVPADDTSAMFMFFAQWFTDSFLRTDPADPRLNTSNHEIDFCQIYGLDEERTTILRGAAGGGRLASQHIDGAEYPPFLLERDDAGDWGVRSQFEKLHPRTFLFENLLAGASDEHKATFFAVGLPHGNSTAGQVVMNTVMLREHNRIAGEIARAHPDWDDERLFQTTRNTMIVLLLTLVVEEYIRHIAPFDVPLQAVPFVADGERWNRSNRCAIEFDLLYRWHSLTPDSVHLGDRVVPITSTVNNNPLVIERGVEAVMRDCSRSRAGRIGLRNTPVFLVDPTGPRPSVEERAVSLMRSARLRSYNEYRTAFGLRRLTDFADLTPDVELRRRLAKLYRTVDDVEWYVGIFAEHYARYEMMGELMTTMVAHDAFTQALTNPLLARDVFTETTFSATGMAILASTSSLEQIVARNAADPSSVHVSFAC